jgi:NADPH-dependent 2,4-dienoyl-CoA reductase/sulfur reductase-like enzyme
LNTTAKVLLHTLALLTTLLLTPFAVLHAAPPELVVIGGTPGGISTAVSAARLGHRVTLVDYHRHIGGMSASGLGASDIEDRRMIRGFFREFVDRIKAHYVATYGAKSEAVKLCRDGYWYEPSVAEHVFKTLIA